MLDLFFSSKVRRKVLALFVTNPRTEYYIREIERITQADFRSVHLELARLEKAGLQRSRRVANLKYYGLNQDYPLYPELKSIIAKTKGWEDEQHAAAVA